MLVVDKVQRHFMENEKEAVEACMTIVRVGVFRDGDRIMEWYLSNSKTGIYVIGRI